MTWKRKQANWKIESPQLSSSTKSTWATTIQGSYLFCTWPGRRISPTILKRRICQTTGTLATFWNGNWFTERRWGVGGKEMKCGIDGRAQKKKRTRKEAKWKQRTRRDRSVMSRVGHFAHGPAHVHKKKTVVVPQIQYIAVCDATTCSLNSECSETVEDDLQNAVQRWCGQCPCRDALAFSHQKMGSLSTSESFVKSQIACSVRIVLCELLLEC